MLPFVQDAISHIGALLDTLFETAEDAIFIMDGVRFLDCNPATLRMYGCQSKEEIVGHTPFDFSPPHQPDGAPSDLKGGRFVAAAFGGAPQQFEWRHCRLDRSEFDVEVRLNRFVVGGTPFLTAVVRDITARKRADAALRHQLAANALIDRILGRCVSCTPGELDSQARMALRELAEFIGADHAYFFVTAPDRATYSCTHETCGPGVVPLGPHFQNVPVGTHRWLEPTLLAGESKRVDGPNAHSQLLVPASATSGEFTGAIGVDSHQRETKWSHTDSMLCGMVGNALMALTERQRSAERLMEEIDFCVGLIDSLPGFFCLYDKDLRLRRWNKNLETATGYSAEELSGKRLGDWHPSVEDRSRSMTAVQALLQHGGGAQYLELELLHKDGSLVPYLLSGVKLDSPSGPMVLGVGIDISERRRAEKARALAEQALRRTEQQLRQSQKMEAIGRLAGGMAHDFNNMLTVVLMFSSLLIEDLRPDDPMRDALEEIKRAADRSTALTRRLLAFSRQQVLEPRVIDLNEIVRSMEEMIRRLVGADVQLVTSLEPSLGKVKVDANQIEQVVMNLVVNARDAMPDGGTLTIKTANVELDEHSALDPLDAKPGSYAMLAVVDTGVGMDRATRASIFEPFFTTKEEGKGTGLGLATAFGVVKQSGGDICVTSEPGRGSTFEIYLPRSDESGIGLGPLAKVVVTTLRGSETILLVEDDDSIRRVARATLAKNGYQVLEAANAGEALLICEQTEGPIDLLLTDVVLPRMNGRHLAERLVAIRPSLRVVYMSGHTEDSLLRGGRLDRGVVFLQKPLTPEALLRKVREVIASAAA
jgi:two-component system cell cycle sensor histidine kinase/response regulator CckA